jgi:hypothetical protein
MDKIINNNTKFKEIFNLSQDNLKEYYMLI